MKTLNEIKKGLVGCLENKSCVACPYYNGKTGVLCVVQVMKDALTLIKQMEEKIAIYEKAIGETKEA